MTTPNWSLPRKSVFLFLAGYLFLYANTNQFIFSNLIAKLWNIVIPSFANLLGREEPLAIVTTGSGDTAYNYFEILLFAFLSIMVMFLILFIDRRRPNYNTLLKWVTLLLRYYLAAQMISYGLAKIFYMQFGPPSAMRLDQLVGDMSPMGLLWTFMGFSKPYTIFTGTLEFIGGILLLSRYTTTIGALTTFGVMVNVMMLNYCYDVPVKLLSTHLVLMSVALILMDGDRLLKFFFTNRNAKPRILPSVTSPKYQKTVTIVKWALISAYMIYSLYNMNKLSKQYGQSREHPVFFGKHIVEEQEVYQDSVLMDHIPESLKWKTMYQNWEGTIAIENEAGNKPYYTFNVDTTDQRIEILSRASSDTTFNELKYDILDDKRYRIYGNYSGDSLMIVLRKVSSENYLLLNRGFNWINEYPFNR